MTEETPVHLSGTEAREGAGPSSMRLVLGIGLLLVVAIFAIILFVAR